MSDREDRLRSLLNKVRAKRPDERPTHAAEVVERIRTASGSVPAAQPAASTSPPSAFSSAPATAAPSSHPAVEPPTSPTVESPTRYSSQPPRVERPLSTEPRARSVRPVPSTPAQSAPSPQRPESIRAQSVAPTGQPIVYASDPPEFPRPKTFGDLLDLTLSLRPR